MCSPEAEVQPLQGVALFVKLDPRLDNNDATTGTLGLQAFVASLGGTVTGDLAAADYVVLQHRKQPEHEAALSTYRRVVGLGWLMATVGRGAPAPLGPRAFKPFPASALVRESDLRLSTTGYAGRARNLLLLLLRCTGAEVTRDMRPGSAEHSVLLVRDMNEESAKIKHARRHPELIDVLNTLWVLDSLLASKLLPRERYRGPGEIMQAMQQLAQEAAAGAGSGGAAEAACTAGDDGEAIVPDSQEGVEHEVGAAAAAAAEPPPARGSTPQPVIPETASAGSAGEARFAPGPSPELLPSVAEEAAGHGLEGEGAPAAAGRDQPAEMEQEQPTAGQAVVEAAAVQQYSPGQEPSSRQAQVQLAEQRATLAAAAAREAEAAAAAATVPPANNSRPLLTGGRRFGATQAMAAVGGLVADLGTAEDVVSLPGAGSEAAGEVAGASEEGGSATWRQQRTGNTTAAEVHPSASAGQLACHATTPPALHAAPAPPADAAGAAAAGAAAAPAASEQAAVDEGEETPDELDEYLAAAAQRAVVTVAAAAVAARGQRERGRAAGLEQEQQAVPVLQATEALDLSMPGGASLEGSETEADEDLPPLHHLLHQGSRPASAAGAGEAVAEPPGSAGAQAAAAPAQEHSPVSTEEVGQAPVEDAGNGSGARPSASGGHPSGGAGVHWRQVRRSVTSDIEGGARSDGETAASGAAPAAGPAGAVPGSADQEQLMPELEGSETEDEDGPTFEDAAEELEPAGAEEPVAEAEPSAEAATTVPAPAAPTPAAAPVAAAAGDRGISPPAPPHGRPGSAEVAQRAVRSSRSRSRSATPSGNGSGRKRKQQAPNRAMFSQQLPEADEDEQHSLQLMKQSEGKAAAASSGRKPPGAAAAARAKAARAKRPSDGVETAPPLKRKGSRLGAQQQQEQQQQQDQGTTPDAPAEDARATGQQQALPAAAEEAALPGPAPKRGRQSAESKPAAAGAAALLKDAAAEQQLALAADKQRRTARARRRGTSKQQEQPQAEAAPSAAAADEEQPAKGRRGWRQAQRRAEAPAEAPIDDPNVRHQQPHAKAGSRGRQGSGGPAAAAPEGKPKQPLEPQEAPQQQQAAPSGRRGRSAAAAAAAAAGAGAAGEGKEDPAPVLPGPRKRSAARSGQAAAATGESPPQQAQQAAATAPAAEETPAEGGQATRGRRPAGRCKAAGTPAAAPPAARTDTAGKQRGQPASGRRSAAKGRAKQPVQQENEAEQAEEAAEAMEVEDAPAPAAAAARAGKRRRTASPAAKGPRRQRAAQAEPGEAAAEDEAAAGRSKRRRMPAGSAGKPGATAACKAAAATADGNRKAEGPRCGTPAAAQAAERRQQGRGRRPITPASAATAVGGGGVGLSSGGHKAVVALSGMHGDEQRRLAAKLRKIEVACLTGSKDSHHWSPGTTHVVASAPRRNQKCLAVMAAGGWLVGPAWVEASEEAGHLIEEGSYELVQAQQELESRAARHWRQRRAATGARAFEGLRCHVAAALDPPFKRADIVNVLKAGGATLLASASGPNCDLAIVAAAGAPGDGRLQQLAGRGVLVAGPRYVVDWVARPRASLAEHVLLRSKPGPVLAAAAAARCTMAAPDTSSGARGSFGEESAEEEDASQASVLFD